MEFLALGQLLSFISQKSYQNHQMKLVTEVGNKAVGIALIGGATYLAGKCVDRIGTQEKR